MCEFDTSEYQVNKDGRNWKLIHNIKSEYIWGIYTHRRRFPGYQNLEPGV